MAEEKKKQPKNIFELQTSFKKKYGKTDKGKDKIKSGDQIESTPLICSTGSFSLDLALGKNGLPSSRIYEYMGKPSGGKSTLSFITAIEAQKVKKTVAIIDLEGTFDKDWFINLGGTVDEYFLLLQPDTGEEAFSMMDDLVESGLVSLIVVDSVSLLSTEEEREKDYGEASMAQLARLMSTGLKKLTPKVNKSDCSIIFINQMRISNMSGYGRPDESTGGNALKFYASARLEITRKEVIGDKDNPDGFKTEIRVVKNKIGVPLRRVLTSLYIGTNGKYGIDVDAEIVDLAIYYNLITRWKKNQRTEELEPDNKGHWYVYKDKVEVHGRPKVISTFTEDESLFKELKEEVISIVKSNEKPEEGSFKDEVEKEEKAKRKKRGEEE